MRGSNVFKILRGDKASHRAQAAIARKWHRARRRVEREPHYANYDTYLIRSLDARRPGRLVPTPKFEDEQTRLTTAMAGRQERLVELVDIMRQMSDEMRELMEAQFLDSVTLCDLTGCGARPAQAVLMTGNVVNDIASRLLTLDYAARNPTKDNLPEFIRAQAITLNSLNNQMQNFKDA